MWFFRWAVAILVVAAASAGFFAVLSSIIWSKDSARFYRCVEREVNRRLKDTRVVSNFNVRMVVVDETSGNYEEE